MIDPSLVGPLLSLGPESGARTRARLSERLSALVAGHRCRRIYVLDLDGRNQLDSDPHAVPGSEMPQARVHRGMLALAAQGKTASSAALRDTRGEMRKTGYAPLFVRGEVVGFVGSKQMPASFAS